MAPAPRPAATVLLLRDEADGTFSVFMVQRSLTSRFMPGAYVFPGGGVDPEDADSADSWGGVDFTEAFDLFGGELSARDAVAHLVAAGREVEEEVGVRLPSLRALQTHSHWITPEIESRRFDTWFLVVRLPEGAEPVHDDGETIASCWVEPKAALAGYGEGDIVMAPPTYYTIWDLARFGSVDDVLADAEQRAVPAVTPRFEQVGDRMALLLPGDALYASESPVPGPTRIVMKEGGRWWVVDGALTPS